MPDDTIQVWFEGKSRRLVWDERKRRSNMAKHRVDFRDLVNTFQRRYVLDFDERHSTTEDRWRLLGLSHDKIVVLAVRIDRGEVRIISARSADATETRLYFEAAFGDTL